jgi:DNA-binding XRE family transcriptional regulator
LHDIVIIWDDEDDRDGNYWHICVEGHGLTCAEVEEVLRDDDSEIEVSRSSGRPTAFGVSGAAEKKSTREKAMNTKHAAKPKWTAADRARHKAIRQEFEHCPTQQELEASGAFEGPIKRGAYFAVKVLIHQLKKAREAAGLTLAAVSKRTGMDQATLSRLENGRQPNPTIDTLWRYASAVGRQLVLTHAEAVASIRGNGKAARTATGNRTPK